MSIILLSLVMASFFIAGSAAIVILFRNYRSEVHRWLAGFLIFSGLWSLIVNLQNPLASTDFNLWVVRLTFVAAIFMAYAMFRFVSAVGGTMVSRLTRYLIGFTTIVIAGLMCTDLVIPYVEIVSGRVVPNRLILYYFVILFILTMCAFALYLIQKSRGNERTRFTKKQKTTIFYGLLSGVVIGSLTNIVLPNILGSIEPSRYASIAIFVWTCSLVYAVVRHRFLDIRLAVVRTAAYLLSLLSLSVIYYLLAFGLSETLLDGSVPVGPVSIGLALVLAFMFQPVKKFFDRITNKLFYRDNYDTSSFFEEINRELTATNDLRSLLERSAEFINTTIKLEQTFFFVYRQDGHHISTGTKGHSKLPMVDARSLDMYFKEHPNSILVSEYLKDESSIKRLLRSHRLAVAMPLQRDRQIIGYLCLGEHQRGDYTRRDIQVLETISDELVIAIQNALSIQEVKELNATLQQRINYATRELRASNAQLQRLDKAKDEFVSMASHQLRTPLTSVKGYISMVLEGDAGKVSAMQEKLLSEAFTSSERMVHLINDFLNVSRLQTGKFMIDKHPVDLAKVVGQELESLSTNASSRNLSFVYKAPKDFPTLDLDEDKIRQVIMNFSDNAIYYSPESSKINVGLAVVGNEAIFTVKDTGIGVPRQEQSQLFSKFYRASNARKQRPDGTGVGLFLAKKVIDSHEGSVIFESTEGKGSTFGFRLPIDKLRTADDLNNLNNQDNKKNDNATSN